MRPSIGGKLIAARTNAYKSGYVRGALIAQLRIGKCAVVIGSARVRSENPCLTSNDLILRRILLPEMNVQLVPNYLKLC